MATGDERRLVWAPLKRALDELHWHYQRIEDKLTPGIPDVNIHTPRGDVWVELKYAKLLGATITLGLRPEQYLWLRAGLQAGRRCYLLARVGCFWWIWNDLLSLERSKHNCCWSLLRRRARRFDTPGEAIKELCLYK